MADTTIHIDAPPQTVFDQLIKAADEVEPGPLKVGDTFFMQQPGQPAISYVLTALEAPHRLSYTLTVADNSYSIAYDYTILPDGNGSLVRLETEGRSGTAPIFGMLLGAFKENAAEREELARLKAQVEAAAAQPTPPAPGT